ncbi:MAG: glycosyltransferase family 1 protein [Betaproteobacteria bacterium]|nr:glycosyltransferase family 1 protein [Betaproteobacteria bacterium]
MPTQRGEPSMDRPIKIAVVTETFPPEVNGVSLSLAKLLEGMTPHCDWRLVRVQRDGLDAPLPGELRLAGFPIPGYARLRAGFPAWQRLRRAWLRERPDLVHIATEGPLGLSALQVARSLKIPVCSDFRTHFEQYVEHYKVSWLEPLARSYLRYFHNRCDLNCVPTEMLARQLKVQCVTRMAAEKNLEVLLQAYRAARQSGSQARLVMVGDGPARSHLERDFPEALFVGMKTGLDLSRCYASADLFCFPSQSETFGNVVLEAMASALPVIAYRHGASAALLQDQEHGWILRDFSPSAFHQALKIALSQWPVRDGQLWKSMGEKAWIKAKTQSWESVVNLMLSHWYALVFPTMKAKARHEPLAHSPRL